MFDTFTDKYYVTMLKFFDKYNEKVNDQEDCINTFRGRSPK